MRLQKLRTQVITTEIIVLKAGQNLLLNNRLWHLRQVYQEKGRLWNLEAIGVSEAALGLTRSMKAIQYGDDLFIRQRQRDYWHGHLRQDWLETERGPALQCQPATWLDLLAVHTRYPASGDIRNEFSWSYSRAAKYRQCPRAYYYHYYAAWEGWQNDAPAPVQRVYLLKNLTDLPRWTGTLVHESIKFALARLKAGQPLVETDLIKQMHARAQGDFEASRSGRYRQKPSRLIGFQEHYYQSNLGPSAWEAAQAQAERYLRVFLNSALYADLRQQPPTTFLNVEELQSFTIAGTKIWVQLDLARQAGDMVYLYDWKTGAVELADLRQQLGIYGLYLKQTWPQWRSIQAVVYLLAEDKLLTFDLDEAILQEAQAQIEAGITQLQGLLLDAEANLAELRRFPMIDDLSVCRHCQFRELCGRDK
ncbi:MAG: PD-(D/E)XK nuclease family protein [Chloroflexi bacterium]|nr:PD-(D/E)XK nuclease family protein [Chloroflexota bacterium]